MTTRSNRSKAASSAATRSSSSASSTADPFSTNTRSTLRTARDIAAAALVVLALGACSDDDAAKGCSTLADIAQDFSDGITSMDDMPEAMERLVRDSRADDELHALAQDAMAEARAGDEDELAAVVVEMNEVCG